ncbi:MAG TPA: cyclopropane-fatty-acyl-phospholipid synthase family protein [Acetobacteraceae bacterium]|nr:cyclopropane-fatty-acyl-phospholipid synthase family protein [Acetobacteraceae bacterium]
MRALFDVVMGQFVRFGSLRIRYPDGRISVHGVANGPVAGMAFADWRAVRRMLFNPALAFGEEYTDGAIEPLDCTLADLVEVLFRNQAVGGEHPGLLVQRNLRRLTRFATGAVTPARARRNVAHHYDLNGRLYSLFLDRDRQYSCAYFPTGNETLEEAQKAKKQHIAAKLLLDRPDLSVLDIGCGWGGLSLTLAQDYGALVTGITLSVEQHAEATARAAAAGLADRVRFELIDYRAVRGRFDRIVSVGMFEHVGLANYAEFFITVRDLLAEDGVALIHAIGRSDGPGITNAWIDRYIFPGGYTPALSEVFSAVEPTGLVATDCEILRLHYAETLRHWRRRFAANRDAIAALYDSRFCRMFELYLIGAEMTFRYLGQMVWQLQLARQQDAVPLTRDYMAQAAAAPVEYRHTTRDHPTLSRDAGD